MKKILLSAGCALLAMGFVSCDSAPAHPDVDTSLQMFSPAVAMTPDSTTNQPVTATPAALQTIAPTSGLAFNPPHGQPGHDCAIAVGAPLKGSPTSPQPVAPVVNAPAPLPVANSNAKLNPPHGQPGHDCSIAVGQPLTSATTPSVTPTPSVQPITSTPVGLPANTGTAKINPPHGEPGHDCSIAVGQPLQ